MKNKLDDTKPIFLQIKESIEDAIINRTWKEDDKIPSTNELAAFYKINPATAGKGVNELVEEDILYKRRGVGMFVSENARKKLIIKQKKTFYDLYVRPLKQRAETLEISETELIDMLKKEEG